MVPKEGALSSFCSQGWCVVLWHSHVRGPVNRGEPLPWIEDKERPLQGEDEKRIRVRHWKSIWNLKVKSFLAHTSTLELSPGMRIFWGAKNPTTSLSSGWIRRTLKGWWRFARNTREIFFAKMQRSIFPLPRWWEAAGTLNQGIGRSSNAWSPVLRL